MLDVPFCANIYTNFLYVAKLKKFNAHHNNERKMSSQIIWIYSVQCIY